MIPLQTRLLPGLPFYVMEYGDNLEPQRFVRLFRGTWRQLPQAARETICKAWRESPLFTEGGSWPAVELRSVVPTLDNVTRGNAPGLGAAGIAWLDLYSRQMIFWSPFLYALPAEHAGATIAHELAHLVLCADPASLDRYRVEHAAGVPYRQQTCERQAGTMVREWGFDMAAAAKWRREHLLELPAFEYQRDGTLRMYTPGHGWRTEIPAAQADTHISLGSSDGGRWLEFHGNSRLSASASDVDNTATLRLKRAGGELLPPGAALSAYDAPSSSTAVTIYCNVGCGAGSS